MASLPIKKARFNPLDLITNIEQTKELLRKNDEGNIHGITDDLAIGEFLEKIGRVVFHIEFRTIERKCARVRLTAFDKWNRYIFSDAFDR